MTLKSVTYHRVVTEWKIHAMYVDCELLEGITVGEEFTLKIKAYNNWEVDPSSLLGNPSCVLSC